MLPHLLYLLILDFAQMSKRLGELWATVPYSEKYVSSIYIFYLINPF